MKCQHFTCHTCPDKSEATIQHWKEQWQQMANLANENLTARRAAEAELEQLKAELVEAVRERNRWKNRGKAIWNNMDSSEDV